MSSVDHSVCSSGKILPFFSFLLSAEFEADAVFTAEASESLFLRELLRANVHYHLDDPGAVASTNTRKRGTYAGGGTLERSVRSVGWSLGGERGVARPGWKLRAAGDYVDRRKNKLRIGLSTRCCTARHLPHLPAVAGVAATVYHKVYNFCQAPRPL